MHQYYQTLTCTSDHHKIPKLSQKTYLRTVYSLENYHSQGYAKVYPGPNLKLHLMPARFRSRQKQSSVKFELSTRNTANGTSRTSETKPYPLSNAFLTAIRRVANQEGIDRFCMEKCTGIRSRERVTRIGEF